MFAARGFTKTYIGCLYVNWRFLRNPHLKVKIISNSHTRSAEISQQILDFLRKLPPMRHLAPLSNYASKTKFNLRGSFREKEESVKIMSISSKNTGSRADLVILDDIEDETCDTHDKREGVKKAAQQISSILHEPGSRWFYKKRFTNQGKNIPKKDQTQLICLGTFASCESVYLLPTDNSPHFLRGAKIRKWAALDQNGKSTFEERLSTEYLLNLKTHHVDSVYWALQYMLDPTLVIGTDCPYKMSRIEKFAVEEKKLPIMWAVIDPAAGNDYTACVIGGLFEGKLYVHEMLNYNNMTSDESLSKVADYISNNTNIKTVHIESNNAAFSQIFKRVARDKKLYPLIEDFHATGNKHARTIAQLEPALNSGDLILNNKLLKHDQIIKEINATTFKEGPPPNVHDDCLDVMAHFVRLHKDKIGYSKARIVQGFVA